jgi:hypothetical protein
MGFLGDSFLTRRMPSAVPSEVTTHPYFRPEVWEAQYTTFSVILDKTPVLTFDKGCKRV